MCPADEGKKGLFSRKKAVEVDASQLKIPTHLAVIMDGNGRWAKKRMLPRSAGHRAGADNLKTLCKNCGHYGIKYVTVYAFSTENWSRPESEVHALMELFVEYFDKYDPELEAEGIRVRFTGDIAALPENIKAVCKRAEEGSKHRDRMTLIVAFNYGGRREIVQAAQKLADKVASGELKSEDITEEMFAKNLYLPDVPDPDLIIRPSGEERTSNFLVWEGAYSELWFSDVLWPDFGMKELTDALIAYTKRDRRFGGLTREKKEEK
ncbi:MAG: isoprenyl transferase [Clostridiales bacterium]|nr:isoprenyl transferase [Clostridiales bacterium]